MGLSYRSSASVTSSGDELAAISWIVAENFGPGSWEYYPMTFHISMEEGSTNSMIVGCISTTVPGSRFPEGFPMPSEYACSGDTVYIKFSEVPQ